MLSPAASSSVAASQTIEENLKQPPSWTLQANQVTKISVCETWISEFKENVEKVARTIATSIYNNFSRGLNETTKSGFTAYPTPDIPFTATYFLSMQQNPAQIKKWAGDKANLPPFKGWLDHYIPLAQQQRRGIFALAESLNKMDLSVTPIPQEFEDSQCVKRMIDILGQRVETFVQEKFAVFNQNLENRNLVVKVEWNPQLKGGFLSSKPSSFSSSLRVSSWLDQDCLAKLQQKEEALLQTLTNSPPSVGVQNQAQSSPPSPSLCRRICSFIRSILNALFYPIRWLCRC